MGRSDLREWLVKDSTIVTLGFLALCAVVLLSLTVLILCGHDGKMVDAIMGITVVCFGGHLWTLLRSRRK